MSHEGTAHSQHGDAEAGGDVCHGLSVGRVVEVGAEVVGTVLEHLPLAAVHSAPGLGETADGKVAEPAHHRQHGVVAVQLQ